MDRAIPKDVKRKKLIRKLLYFSGVSIVVVIIVLVISGMLEPSIPITTLHTGEVDRGMLEVTVHATGKLVPFSEEIIVSPVSSRILEVYKHEGDTVEVGEPLLKLDISSVETEYQSKLDEKEMMKSKLIQVQVRLDNALSDMNIQYEIQQMKVKQYESELLSEIYLDSIGMGTPSKVRKARLDYDEAKLQVEQMKQKIENEKKNTEAELRVKELELNIFEKSLVASGRILNDARILSPHKATLTYLNNQVGAHVSQGTQVAVLADLTRFKVEAEVADSHQEKLVAGSKAVIKAGQAELQGTVVNITPSVRNGVINFIVIPENVEYPGLRSGLRADVHILHGISEDVLRLPNGDYYTYGRGEYRLWVIDKNGNARKRRVMLGSNSYEYVEVVNGLQVEEKVILNDMGNYRNKEVFKINY